jgi:hypothetical protein
VTARLTPAQRDVLIGAPGTPRALGHALHHAHVDRGELSIRLNRESVDALIAAAAAIKPEGLAADRALDTLLRYLETLADRFEDPEERTGDDGEG